MSRDSFDQCILTVPVRIFQGHLTARDRSHVGVGGTARVGRWQGRLSDETAAAQVLQLDTDGVRVAAEGGVERCDGASSVGGEERPQHP